VTTPPPNSTDAEIAVLHSMISYPDVCISAVMNILTEDCFYKSQHKVIFNTITRLLAADSAVNILTVSEDLKNTDKLEDAGGVYYLFKIQAAYYPSDGAEDAARIVFEKYGKRCLRESGKRQELLADDPSTDMFEVLEQTETIIGDIKDKLDKMRPAPTMFSLSRESFERMASAAEGEILQTGIPSGFCDLDEITGGFAWKDFIILAARPSMGKTALALNIARHAAREVPVGIFSLEMSASALYNRILSAETGVSGVDIKRNRLSEQEISSIVSAHGLLAELPIHIDDTPGQSLLALKSKAKRMKREKNVQLIIIDYLQLITPPKADSREAQISAISRNLKVMAKELNVPVIALSQLNREVDKRPDKTPHLADLRESGSLEQDADIVMFVNRLEQYGIENYEDGSATKDTAQIIIAKNREGEIGTVKLAWNRYCTKFSNYETWRHGNV